MKGAEQKANALKLLAEIAGRAEAAGDELGLAAALQPLLDSKWCSKAYLAIFEGDSARIIGPAGKADAAPVQGSSLESVKTGGVYVDNGIGKYSGFYDERRLAEEGFTGYLCAPMRSGAGPAIGAVCVARKDGNEFTSDEAATAALAASYLSAAISKASLSTAASAAQKISSLLLENSAGILLVASQSRGEIIEANTGAEVASGYSSPELKRLKLAQLFGMDLIGTDKAAGLFRLTRKNGNERVLDLKIGRVEVGGEKFIVLSGSDATERLAGESDYKDVVESISDIIFSLNNDGEIKSINDEVERALNRKKDSLVGLPLGSIVFERDYKALGEALQSPRDIKGIELRLLTGTNEQRWFELSGRCYRDANGSLLKATGVLRDIDEKKRASEQAALVADVTNNSSDAVVYIDTAGMIQFSNKSAQNMFGYSEGEMRGRSAFELHAYERRNELDRLVQKLNASGSTEAYETEMVKKNGDSVFVRVSASAYKDEEGRVVGYSQVIKDLTVQKRVEEAEKRQKSLEDRNRYLSELDKEKSAFVSSVSHELRTPLTNIHGYSALLVDEEAGSMSEDQKKFVSIIYSETERLTKLINDLLDQSRMDRGKFKISPEQFDLRDLQEKCSCAGMAGKKGLYVNWEFAEDVQQVYGDPARISQVLLNLVSNAVKFTDAGGVTVKVYKKSANFVQVDVIDTGPGISEEDQKRLFKPFSQIPMADGLKRGGSGLGLTISKGIIKLHGGQISVSSTPGRGSCFWFTLRTQAPRARGKPKLLREAGL